MNSSLSGTGLPNCHRGHCRNLTLRCQRPLTSLSVSSFPPQSSQSDRRGSEVSHELLYAIAARLGRSLSSRLAVSSQLLDLIQSSRSPGSGWNSCSCWLWLGRNKVEISKPRNSINQDHIWLQAGPLAHLPLSVTRLDQFQEEEYHQLCTSGAPGVVAHGDVDTV